jgi:hypothetical protein
MIRFANFKAEKKPEEEIQVKDQRKIDEEIGKRKEERIKDETYEESRDRLINWVSIIIYKHVKYSEDFIHPPTTGA